MIRESDDLSMVLLVRISNTSRNIDDDCDNTLPFDSIQLLSTNALLCRLIHVSHQQITQ